MSKISRREALALIFVASTVIMLGIAAISTYNYYQFYSALSRLQLKWTSLQERPEPGQILNATAVFVLENPTGYRGLSLIAFQPNIVFQTSNTTSRPTGLATPRTSGPLDPGTTMTFTITFASRTDPGTSPRYILTVDLVLSTFLDPVAVILASYQCTAQGTPGPCDQAAVSIHALGGGGGGGG